MSRFSSLEDVEEVARRILSLVSDPVTIGGQCVWNACSIGIAIFPNDGEDISALVKNADSALYFAKSQSRGSLSNSINPSSALKLCANHHSRNNCAERSKPMNWRSTINPKSISKKKK